MMTDTDTGDMLKQFVNRAGSLYSLPAVAIEVLELTDRPNVDVTALKKCVERDPALTAKLLRVVNSSLFGLTGEVSDLNQALALLGVEPLKLLVLGFSLPETLFSQVEADMLERFWRFALVKAVAARRIAARFWDYPPDEAFIAGLLQEIGVLLLIRELGEPYVHFLKSAIAMGEDVRAMEDSVLGFNHAGLSAQLLDHWNLPAAIVRAVAMPHDVEQLMQLPVAQQPLPQILHLATLLASILVDHRGESMAELLAAAARYQRISIDQIDGELDELQEQVELMAGVFAVPLNNPLRYRDILADAQRTLAAITSGAVTELLTTAGAGPTATDRQLLDAAASELSQAARATVTGASGSSTPARAPSTPSSNLTVPPSPAVAPAAVQTAAVAVASADPGLIAGLANAIATARIRRCEFSLILLEISNYEDLILVAGAEAAAGAIHTLGSMLNTLAAGEGVHLQIADARYASVLVGYDRRRGVEYARRVVRAIPNWSLEHANLSIPAQCAAAVVSSAAPGRSYEPAEFTEAGERCLFAARAARGDTVKSIDLL